MEPSRADSIWRKRTLNSYRTLLDRIKAVVDMQQDRDLTIDHAFVECVV